MNSNKVRIKNCACYYFDDIIRLEDFSIDNISIDGKSHENILIYGFWYKKLIGSNPLRIRLDDKIDGIIRITSIISGITYIFSPYFAKIKVDSYDFLPIK